MENKCYSPNFTIGRNGFSPEYIVIHIEQGHEEGTKAWFANPASQVSAHLACNKDGSLDRFIEDENSAWHSGISTTIGTTFTGFKYYPNRALVNVNNYTLGLEHEGFPDVEITEEQYKTSSLQIAYWCNKFNIPVNDVHIVSHSSICSLHGKCPNGAINMEKLIQLTLTAYNNIS